MGCMNSVEASRGNKNQLIQVGARKIVKQSIIAEGAYGSIWKCLQPDTQEIFALKVIRLQTKQLTTMFEKQVHALTQMKNNQAKHVVKIIQSARYATPEYKIGCILLQFSHMSLYEQIQNKRFTVPQIISILLQILKGIMELHNGNFYHLDMKPQNVIFCQNCYKVCDLGSSIQGKIDFSQIDKRRKTQIQEFIESNSTLMYRAPQMIDTTGNRLDQKTDIWMIGLIGYVMLYRKHPFENQGKLAILCPIEFSSEGKLQEILKKMLTIDGKSRISCKDAKNELKRLQYELSSENNGMNS